MAGRVQREIKQTKPFTSLSEEAIINLQRTADVLMRGVEEVLKTAELSPTQYNVLRILRGAGPAGLACREIGSRMITRDPDITRLLDRLESRELVERSRETKDRRIVKARVTSNGLRMLKALDLPIHAAHEKLLGHLGQNRLLELIQLLEDARGGTKNQSGSK